MERRDVKGLMRWSVILALLYTTVDRVLRFELVASLLRILPSEYGRLCYARKATFP
jgi:hypothetical protein